MIENVLCLQEFILTLHILPTNQLQVLEFFQFN